MVEQMSQNLLWNLELLSNKKLTEKLLMPPRERPWRDLLGVFLLDTTQKLVAHLLPGIYEKYEIVQFKSGHTGTEEAGPR